MDKRKVRIRSITFKEFAYWANQRCCDGQWGIQMAIVSAELISDIYRQAKEKHPFSKKRREQYEQTLWEFYREQDFKEDAEIEVDFDVRVK